MMRPNLLLYYRMKLSMRQQGMARKASNTEFSFKQEWPGLAQPYQGMNMKIISLELRRSGLTL